MEFTLLVKSENSFKFHSTKVSACKSLIASEKKNRERIHNTIVVAN